MMSSTSITYAVLALFALVIALVIIFERNKPKPAVSEEDEKLWWWSIR